MTEDKQPLKDQVRGIRWRMAHEKTRFFDEFWIIPRWLKGLTVALFIVGQVVAQVAYFYGSKRDPLIAYVGSAAGITLFIGFVLLFFGYINRDAKRRGMNSTLWTLLAIFVPYLIGVIIYFLIREPLPHSCPGCGAIVNAWFNFCPECKHNLRPSCPQCKREVRLEDKYCPYCAQELTTTNSPSPEQKSSHAGVTPVE
jgi:RNA polymerase subunit RPABC4/transcription elongation factor Spt4